MRTQQTNAKQSNKKKRYAAVAVAGAIGLATAGGAYSYWTSLGDGSGTASTSAGNAKPFVVTGGAADAMFPGDTPQTVTATITNSGQENYTVSTLKVWVSTDKAADCDGSNFLVNGAAASVAADSAASIPVTQTDLAPTKSTTTTFTMQFNNKAKNQDGCKGAAVTIHYLAS